MSAPGATEQRLRLVLVTEDRLLRGRDLTTVCQAAEQGGVTSVLVRREDFTPRALAEAVRALMGSVGLPVLVAGRADVAIACGSTGVQLATSDPPVQVIRRIAPRDFLIGAAVGSLEGAAAGRGADYWTIGPFRRADGHESDGTGLEGLVDVVRRSEGRPCIASGGIRPDDVGPILQAGAVGVAVGKGILASQDIEAAARAYRSLLD